MRISDWSSDVCSSDLVPFGIPELQRVFADGGRGEADPSIVEDLSKARLGADPLVKVALRADRQIFLELAGEQHLSATPAFVPEIIGRLPLRETGQALTDAGEPAHAASCFLASRTALDRPPTSVSTLRARLPPPLPTSSERN